MGLFNATKTRVQALPPLHRDLTLERRIGWSQPPAEWAELRRSLALHDEVTKGKRKYRLPDGFTSVALPLLELLCDEAAPGSAVALAFDGAFPDPARAPETRLPDTGIRRKIREYHAVHRLMAAEATLRDASTLLVAVDCRLRLRKWRQSRSGKTKFKSKVKTSYRYRAEVTLPKGVAPARPAVPTPPWLVVKVKPGKHATVIVTAKGGEQPQLEPLLDVALEAERWSPTARTTVAAS